jgi:hypothetical protein
LWTTGPALMWLGDARLDGFAPGRGRLTLARVLPRFCRVPAKATHG